MGRKAEELTGQKFGKLTVIGKGEVKITPSGFKHATCRCRCDCGNVIDVVTSALKRGNTKSCGCSRGESISKNLMGQKFGRLTVIEKAEDRLSPYGYKYKFWKCQCDCGNIVEIQGSSLLSGATKSCGCLRKETTREKSYQDLTGQRFGRLTVIKEYGHKMDKISWLCKCDCGNECIIIGNNLKNGGSQSCGCLQKELSSKRSFIDLTGQTFGRLTVVKRVEDYISPSNYRQVQYLCKCECGNEVIVGSTGLSSGHTKSCGCLQKEIVRNIGKKMIIDLTGQKFGKLTVIKRAEDYIQSNGRHVVQWACKCECGNETIASAGHLKDGSVKSCGCLVSYAEINVGNFLSENKIDFKKQKTFKDLHGTQGGNLSYDFYLPQHNLLIECQGQQHIIPVKYFGGEKKFLQQQEHDKRKREYAQNNGYDLLEIWYYDYNRIEEILQNKLIKENIFNDTE